MPDIASVRHFNEYCGMIKKVRIDLPLILNRGWSPQNPVFSRFGFPDRAKTVCKSIRCCYVGPILHRIVFFSTPDGIRTRVSDIERVTP